MRIRPRQQILDVWEAIARLYAAAGGWRWGGRGGRSSVSDAEQLLCLLGPATRLPVLAVANPDWTADDIAHALRGIGTPVRLPVVVLDLTLEYLDTYSTADGTPVFSGGGRFVVMPGEQGAVTAAQQDLEVVDSYAISVTLTLAALGFAKALQPVVTRPELRDRVERLRSSASRRLTAALVGLLRSFSVHAFTPDDEYGERQVHRVSQDDRRKRVVIEDLRRQLMQVRARFRNAVRLGSGEAAHNAMDSVRQLFECGWSWGVVSGAPEVTLDGVLDPLGQQDGVAEGKPYLYFTAVALDAIEDLMSPRTDFNLLDPAQQRLAGALDARRQLTQAFWACVATFGAGSRWPLEDLPWQTTDGLKHEYYSVLVSGMVVQERITEPAADADLARVGAVLAEQAGRSKITRRATDADRDAVRTHDPGVHEPLRGSDTTGGPLLAWLVADIAPLLLDRSLRLASHFDAGAARTRVLDLADLIWDHMLRRRIEAEPVRGLWDQPGPAFPEFPGIAVQTEVSWYHTKRMIDCLISAGRIVGEAPRPSPDLAHFADEMLIEAEYLLQVEFLREPGGGQFREHLEGIASLLDQARAVSGRMPGVAVGLAGEALTTLHRRARARVQAARTLEL
jgi:hypothetical protein